MDGLALATVRTQSQEVRRGLKQAQLINHLGLALLGIHISSSLHRTLTHYQTRPWQKLKDERQFLKT